MPLPDGPKITNLNGILGVTSNLDCLTSNSFNLIGTILGFPFNIELDILYVSFACSPSVNHMSNLPWDTVCFGILVFEELYKINTTS